MQKKMAKLRSSFEHIVMNTPPVSRAAGAGLIGKLSNQILLLVRSGHHAAPHHRPGRAGAEGGDVGFPHQWAETACIEVYVEAGLGGPTDSQRQLYREIVERHPRLWPQIAAALAAQHRSLNAVMRWVDPPSLSIEPIIAGQPRRWSLQYSFDLPGEGDITVCRLTTALVRGGAAMTHRRGVWLHFWARRRSKTIRFYAQPAGK